MGPLFESPPRPLLKSGLQPLAKYGIHLETIRRRPEQMYTSSDTKLEWPEGGYSLSQIRMKTRGALLNSCLGPLARYGIHQETMGGRWEQVYLPSNSRLDLPGILINGGGAKCGHYSSHSLGHYLCQAWTLDQIWHWCKLLSNVAEYCYQIC